MSFMMSSTLKEDGTIVGLLQNQHRLRRNRHSASIQLASGILRGLEEDPAEAAVIGIFRKILGQSFSGQVYQYQNALIFGHADIGEKLLRVQNVLVNVSVHQSRDLLAHANQLLVVGVQ